ncbi:MAG TPA: MAPEG family protein [Burkholderiaceae bacterium]|nr:MAPEG family protein [Burkholderiaceae bacterium]
MTSFTWAAIVTLLNIALLLWVGAMVGQARTKYHIEAPATTGHPMFERAFRIQMNTIENTVMFLPTVWLVALYGAATIVGAAGAVWIVGRIIYALGYRKDPAKRGLGYGISLLAFAVLLLDAIVGLVRALFVA